MTTAKAIEETITGILDLNILRGGLLGSQAITSS
jgi:hypothetical protein